MDRKPAVETAGYCRLPLERGIENSPAFQGWDEKFREFENCRVGSKRSVAHLLGLAAVTAVNCRKSRRAILTLCFSFQEAGSLFYSKISEAFGKE